MSSYVFIRERSGRSILAQYPLLNSLKEILPKFYFFKIQTTYRYGESCDDNQECKKIYQHEIGTKSSQNSPL